MAVSKIAITLDETMLKKIDGLVRLRVFPNRSRAIQAAVEEKLMRLEKTRLARECTKLDFPFEQKLADEGIVSEVDEWPEY
ncbi:ribbon-helix-helix domain-containing protein [Acidobacteriota bacterium]